MNTNQLIIRYEKVDRQSVGDVARLVGFVRARNLLSLFDAADLEANPRSAKVGNVTSDIIESIETTPDLFPFKTKGILIAASSCVSLQRKRYQLTFEDARIEGILDGGHNTLAIGLYVLKQVMGDNKAWRKINNWTLFKEAWVENRPEVDVLKQKYSSGEGGPLDFLIPVELLIPSDFEDVFILTNYTASLLEVGAARNNNVQLTLEARANKKGFYDDLRKALPLKIAERIEWKPNDGGKIKVRDIVALSWIPLSVIELPEGVNVPAAARIYSAKGECTKAFDALMNNKEVSKSTGGAYTHELHNSSVASALKIAAQLPELYDLIYSEFPSAYNDGGNGRFGRLSPVKMASDMHTKPRTSFTEKEVQYRYPDGFIMPLVYGLKALMEMDENGEVKWIVPNPQQFVRDNLNTIVKKYRVIIEAFSGEPQKIGKNDGSYTLAMDAFETEILKLNSAN